MKIIVADNLPASALEVLRSDGWTVDARTGRSADWRAISPTRTRCSFEARRRWMRPDRGRAAAAIIARAGAGVDNVDVDAASARGILVVNAPGANSISVAEHACALMLALARAVPAADRAMKDGRWEKKRASSATSFAARRSASSASDASVRKWRIARGRSACTSWRTIRSSRPRSAERPRRPAACRSTSCARRPIT